MSVLHLPPELKLIILEHTTALSSRSTYPTRSKYLSTSFSTAFSSWYPLRLHFHATTLSPLLALALAHPSFYNLYKKHQGRLRERAFDSTVGYWRVYAAIVILLKRCETPLMSELYALEQAGHVLSAEEKQPWERRAESEVGDLISWDCFSAQELTGVLESVLDQSYLADFSEWDELRTLNIMSYSFNPLRKDKGFYRGIFNVLARLCQPRWGWSDFHPHWTPAFMSALSRILENTIDIPTVSSSFPQSEEIVWTNEIKELLEQQTLPTDSGPFLGLAEEVFLDALLTPRLCFVLLFGASGQYEEALCVAIKKHLLESYGYDVDEESEAGYMLCNELLANADGDSVPGSELNIKPDGGASGFKYRIAGRDDIEYRMKPYP